MKCIELQNGIKLVIVEGDITRIKTDAIVNAANSLMIMGGGVAGAIKRRGGITIEEEALKHAPVPVGAAIATSAGKLPAKYVIHAPTMERPAMRIPLENAVKATAAALATAEELCINSIAFPAMGAGVGGLSVREVAEAMVKVIKSSRTSCVKKVVLVAWGMKAFTEMVEGAEAATGKSASECEEQVFV